MSALILLNNTANAATITETVFADGKEWAQPALFTNLSANDFMAQCPNRVCEEGELNGWDMLGWQWATIEEVGALFSSLSPHPGGVFFYIELRGNWDLNIFNAGFNTTQSSSSDLQIRGIAADKGEVGHYVGHWKRDGSFGGNDWVNTSEEFPEFFTRSNYGGWFYRVPSSAFDTKQVPILAFWQLLVFAVIIISMFTFPLSAPNNPDSKNRSF